MSGATLPVGTVIADRYRVLAQIGSGGFGAVYKAIHLVTQRRVALKALWPQFAKEPEFRKRFLRESRLAAQIGSEFIVDVLDAGIDEQTDMPFLVMELLEGECLSGRIARKGRLTADEVAVYLSQVAVALDRTHSFGIVHRDLKPANMFLTQRSDGSPLVKILDFGIAKLLASSGLDASNSLGTPLYMAPEQFRQLAITPAADIYALGMIAFVFLVGHHYFKLEQREASNVYLFAATISSGPSEPATVRATRYGSRLPPAVDDWFARACNVVPSERPQSASDAVRELCAALGVAARGPLVPIGRRVTGALSVGAESEQEIARSPQPVPAPEMLRVTAPLPSAKTNGIASTVLINEAGNQMPTSSLTLHTIASATEHVPADTPSPAMLSAPSASSSAPSAHPHPRRALVLAAVAVGALGLAGIAAAAIVGLSGSRDEPLEATSAAEPTPAVSISALSAPAPSPTVTPTIADSPTPKVQPSAKPQQTKAAEAPAKPAIQPPAAPASAKPSEDLYTRE